MKNDLGSFLKHSLGDRLGKNTLFHEKINNKAVSFQFIKAPPPVLMEYNKSPAQTSKMGALWIPEANLYCK